MDRTAAISGSHRCNFEVAPLAGTMSSLATVSRPEPRKQGETELARLPAVSPWVAYPAWHRLVGIPFGGIPWSGAAESL